MPTREEVVVVLRIQVTLRLAFGRGRVVRVVVVVEVVGGVVEAAAGPRFAFVHAREGCGSAGEVMEGGGGSQVGVWVRRRWWWGVVGPLPAREVVEGAPARVWVRGRALVGVWV